MRHKPSHKELRTEKINVSDSYYASKESNLKIELKRNLWRSFWSRGGGQVYRKLLTKWSSS